jgi:hypothetical protein
LKGGGGFSVAKIGAFFYFARKFFNLAFKIFNL